MSFSPRIKLCMVIENFPVATETFILRQVQALDAEVATGVIDNEACREMGLAHRVVSLTGNRPFELERHMKKLDRIWKFLVGDFGPYWRWGTERAWHRYLDTRQPDVVLAQFGPNGMRCMKGCRDRNIPLVVHFHGYDASLLLKKEPYVKRLPKLFGYARHVVVVSNAMKEALLSFGCPEYKATTISYGVPIEDFDIGGRQDRQPCRFLSVGRFVPKKAPLLTIKAFALCASQVPDVALTMIGNGPLLDEAKHLAARNGLSGKVKFPGILSNRTVRTEMQEAGCFLQHSRTVHDGDSEGWPVSIAEAAATGLPIISTLHAGIPEQVVEGETGFLVKEGDWESMAGKMILLAQNARLRKKMGMAGRKLMTERGCLSNQVEKLRRILLNAANKEVA